MAVTGSLEQIRAKVRKITGRPSANQLSTDELDNYINDFYVYDLPQYLKLWDLKDQLSPIVATTASGARVLTEGTYIYTVDSNKYLNIEPPFYVGGYEIQYFQDVRSFNNYFNNRANVQTLTTGTGVTGPYAGTITTTPVIANTVFISVQDGAGNTLTAGVDSTGTITGDVTAGAVDLTTGAVTNLTWTAIIPIGNDITVQSLSLVQARPQAVLYLDNTLTFYPIPDVSYEIACTAYYNPDDLVAGNEPEIRQWWNLIAFGASMKIFQDNLDLDSYQKVRLFFDEAKRLVLRKTLKQLSTQRVATIYDDLSTCRCGWFGNTNI